MNRKFSILVILFICFVSKFLFAQSNTFERSYPSFGITQLIGLKTLELPGGGYLYAASQLSYKYVNGSNIQQWTNVILIKTDQNGYTLWRKEIQTLPTEYRKTNQILITKQSEILLITVQSSDSLNALNLKKFDFNGNETFNSNLITDSSIVGCAITKTDRDDYLVAYCDASPYNPIKIIKFDSQLNLIWHKKIYVNFGGISRGNFCIKKWGKNDYVIGFKSRILKINSNGDSLLTSGRRHNYISEGSDGAIIISGDKAFTKLDSMNNVVWTRNFVKDPGPSIQSADGNYIISVKSSNYAYSDSILKIDELGNLIWERAVNGSIFNLSENSDKSLLYSGILYSYFNNYNYTNSSWLLKTNSSGEYNAINLITPLGFEKFLTFNKYLIGWHSNGVEKVNLRYSTDDGNNWKQIANNIPADTGQYSWSVPQLFADSIKIKIVDSDNPYIFNYSEYPIYVSIYQPTDYISTNEIFMWIGNNGMGSHDPRTDGSGFYWPGGDSATISAIFVDGLVWGGKVNGEIRVNGDTYRYGLQPGRILEDGKADNPLSTQSKIFKIRKDWQSLPESNLKDRLEYDYNHWPVEAGAPWDDVNEDGVYTPGFDKPKCIGDETLFYVANDLDTARSRFTYGSDPIGLEFQTTIFGFTREDLKDVVFKKYKVINKSNTDITDMYFTYWADVDMGDSNDDLEAFDSTYNMAYVYNFDNNDEYYYGTPPPAVAHMIVQGPIVPSTYLDSARYDNGWRTGFRNIGMTSSGLIVKSGVFYPNDPVLGVYEGTIQFYNTMQGLRNDGSYIINPLNNEATIWPLTGDPVTGTGWYLVYPGMNYGFDQRYHVPTGPFNLAVGDTQEIVIAIPIAKGTDNINSITKLRELAAHVQEFYNIEFVDILNTKQTVAPTGYTLFQNYPNPFNPKTTVEYEVPEKSNVTIKIYDILGSEVKTLVNNEEKVRWRYKVQFDASSLSSGVYFYRIQAGSFTQTKKMMVLK